MVGRGGALTSATEIACALPITISLPAGRPPCSALKLDAKRGDRRLRAGRACLASSAAAGKDGERSPVLERGAPGCTRDVAVRERAGPGPPMPTSPTPTDRALAPAETDAVILPATISPLKSETTIVSRKRLRRGGRAGRREDSRARAPDADDRAVRRVLERLNVRGRARSATRDRRARRCPGRES